jgi:hypothetical protein
MIKTDKPRAALQAYYERMAEEYLRSLPLEHFMESTPQSTQHKITVESLDLVQADRADVHVFSELLVQYPVPRRKRPGQVCPDIMVVIHDGPLDPIGSYDLPLQPATPFWMLEFLSKSNKRKDYVDNMRQYERALKVPYYLLFDPDKQKLTLYHHGGTRYQAVAVNASGRLGVPELDLEVAILDRWVRFWYQSELLPLPADLLREVKQFKKDFATMKRRAEAAEREVAELRAQLHKTNGKKNGKH